MQNCDHVMVRSFETGYCKLARNAFSHRKCMFSGVMERPVEARNLVFRASASRFQDTLSGT